MRIVTRPLYVLLLATALLTAGAVLASSALAAGDANEAACPNEALSGFSTSLPDCRAYELVTPPFKDGYAVGAFAIAEDGSRVLGNTLGSLAGATGAPATRESVGAYYELARGQAGWATVGLVPENPQYRAATTFDTASADLSQTLFQMPTGPVGQDYYYIRGSGNSLAQVGPLTPPTDGPSLEPGPWTGVPVDGTSIEGASADLSHIVFGVKGAYGWKDDPTYASQFDLYEYTVGADNSKGPQMVAVTGGPGSTDLIGDCGAELGGTTSRFNAISEDGSTVIFTPLTPDAISSTGCGSGPTPSLIEPYARINGAETIALATPECHAGCASEPTSDGLFAGASHDGSKAFFLSTQKLAEQATEDTTPEDSAYLHAENSPGGNIFYAAKSGCQQASGSGCNLYEYDFARSAGERLVTVSAGSSDPHVQGVVRISQDGSHAYFVAQGQLTTEKNQRGEVATPGMDNMYVYENLGGGAPAMIRFIAALSSTEDENLWGSDSRPAQATPDGEYLVFESHADLTGDDTSSGVWQVFEYDAATRALRRVSIGDRGYNDDGNGDEYSATIPIPEYEGKYAVPLPKPLAISGDGSDVFFESADALTPGAGVPEAGRTTQNIYEYREGHVYLIYGGDVSESGQSLVGTSFSGEDVFFQTQNPLVPEDTDTQPDVYDARINGGSPPASTAAGCHGEGCLGALSGEPSLPGAGSASQPGGENLAAPAPVPVKPAVKSKAKVKAKRCKRGAVLRHGKCVRPKAKRSVDSKRRG
jgi:hypothetical protein